MKTKEISPEQREKLLRYYENRRRYDIKRILDQRYTSIKQRSGTSKHHPSGAKGLPYLTKQEFLVWYEETKESFEKLYKAWVAADFPLNLSPSVDRKDSKIGYISSNMQWLAQGDNTRKKDK